MEKMEDEGNSPRMLKNLWTLATNPKRRELLELVWARLGKLDAAAPKNKEGKIIGGSISLRWLMLMKSYAEPKNRINMFSWWTAFKQASEDVGVYDPLVDGDVE